MITTLPKKDFKGYTAVLGSPSVGNVSQLCIDLVISSLKCTHIGMIWHEAILPLVGADPYNDLSSKICSSNDIYCSEMNKILLFQLRAPLQRNYLLDYLTKLVEYLNNVGIEHLIILSGLFAHQRDDSELLGGSFRYVTCPRANAKFGSTLTSFGWIRMKDNNEENKFSCPKMPGSGLTRMLFNMCIQANISCTGLLLFCSEGDNSHDALQLLKNLNTLLPLIPDDLSTIVYPPSWKYLFGNSLPRNIY
uniref:Proteasome assembly chaperone 2 n=1 Tax=Riptortus pedestris TaxID=329032 RepID=R4WIU3_RIPPE|nr:conserved hypothetical protein [Riptortus pedestris]